MDTFFEFVDIFSLTLYTPPVPRQKGVGQLGQYVHKAEESQSSACQKNTMKMKCGKFSHVGAGIDKALRGLLQN